MSNCLVTAHSDGSALGNPGPGGYGVVLRYGEHVKELSHGFELTTNNRMELYGVIAALEALTQPCRVEIKVDSKYISDTLNKNRLTKWQRNGWRRGDKKAVANVDLWKRLVVAIERHESVKVSWVRGHSGDTDNERCDALAKSAAATPNLSADVGYVPVGNSG